MTLVDAGVASNAPPGSYLCDLRDLLFKFFFDFPQRRSATSACESVSGQVATARLLPYLQLTPL